jgi:hypothetical protein
MADDDHCADVDERWRALARGELSDDEVAALREGAQRCDEGRALFELYRPFTDDERERLSGRLRARLREQRAPRRPRRTATVTVIIAAAVAAAWLWRSCRV